MKITFTTLCLLLSLNLHVKAQANGGSSVLAEGDWYKIAISESGLYKIDFAFLQKMGQDPSQINPQKLRLFGHGGGMLPQENSAPRIDDLSENAIWVSGEADGRFDQNDFILFYGQGPDFHSFDRDRGVFSYQKNLYSDSVFYFLNLGLVDGKRIEKQNNLGTDYPKVNTFLDVRTHEQELTNILSSGREWYGERFNGSESKTFSFEGLSGIAANSEVILISSLMAQSINPASFSARLNSVDLGTLELGTISTATYAEKGRNRLDTLRVNSDQLASSTEAISFDLTFNAASSGKSEGYLNFLMLQLERKLSLYGSYTRFRFPLSLSQGNSSFVMGNASSDLMIWDITDPHEIKDQEYELSGNEAIFGIAHQGLRDFIAFKGTDFAAPDPVIKVANQDLHGDLLPELVIISHPSFRTEAERLAAFRQQHDGLETKVVTPNQIYNEFSSGAQDVTAIRDYLKYLFDQGNQKLKYALLFGRCSYDYKNRITDNTNFVPTYQSRNSLHPIFSHSSDDYFGFLDADEGLWDEDLSGTGGQLLEIAVGRLPVKNGEEAAVVVDKLIHYSSAPEALGAWRQNVYYIADDGDFNLHQRDADRLAVLVDTSQINYNVNKIFLDAFPQIKTANGESAEAVNLTINEAVKKGALIINYTGHGSEFRWAEETILNNTMIESWENFDRLPLFVTATCEFGRHDDPKRISGAEILITNPRGGAIGLVTTARPVFASKNFVLNQAFYEAAFEPVEGELPRLGDIFLKTKNDSYDIVANRNFALLADPSLRLAYPQHQLVITGTKEGDDGQPVDTLSALSQITLEGAVQDANGNLIGDYNGKVKVTVFDQPSQKQTLGSETGGVFSFLERNNVIFRGNATVVNGLFTTSFVVPKNISYAINRGKISLYASKKGDLEDAGGADTDIYIGGSNKNAPLDNTPPEIALFMDDSSFVSGGITGSNTLFLAKLIDNSGINISNVGLGQDIVAQLNQEATFVLNDFYEAATDDFTVGWVTYPLDNLEPGAHKLELKVWDVYNNSNKKSIEFIVAENEGLALERVLNYPNPVKNQTQFVVEHNQPGDRLEVTVSIYDDRGGLVKRLQRNYSNSPSSLDGIFWDGSNDQGTRLKAGLYVYKVLVRSLTNGDNNQEYQKLVLIN